VVVVPFPYSDRLTEKRRPAIVVSSNQLMAKYRLIWLVMVTSADNRRWDCDVDVSDLASAGLPAPSRVRPAKLATIDSDRVVQRVGRLTNKDTRALEAQLRLFLG